MPKILRITEQKRHSNRYNCYLDNDERISVTDDMILKFRLSAGLDLQPEDLEAIAKEADMVSTREKALELLSLRDHSARELSLKLLQKGYQKPHIEKVIKDLQNKKYLDDARFARYYAEELIGNKRLGPRLLREKLFSRGISATEVSNILDSYENEKILENCRYHYLKKIKSLRNEEPRKAVEKMTRFLLGKGFNWESIRPVLDEMKTE